MGVHLCNHILTEDVRIYKVRLDVLYADWNFILTITRLTINKLNNKLELQLKWELLIYLCKNWIIFIEHY